MEAATAQAVVSQCYAPSFYKFPFIHLCFLFLSKFCTNSTLLSMKEEDYPWQGADFWCWFLVLEPPSSDCALGRPQPGIQRGFIHPEA